MCGVKLVDKKSTKDMMLMLDLSEAIDQMPKANSVRWYMYIIYKYVLRKDKKNFLKMALDFNVMM